MTRADVTVAIPTYRREKVLVATIEALLAQSPPELLVVDQTERHSEPTEEVLGRLEARRAIRWIRLPRPSITRAVNTALQGASRPIVLFLDDDIVPGSRLIEGHASAYQDESVWAVAGQVLQLDQKPVPPDDPGPAEGFATSLYFPFNSNRRAWIRNGMAGNLSVRRDRALAIGGFDENFVGVAYRFETEFCRRIVSAGGRVLFEPAASIRHLKAAEGGTRVHGDHMRSASPAHGVGDYYFALRQGLGRESLAYILRRPVREVSTLFHLKHPWWIPVKLLGEFTALCRAIGLALSGPRYIGRAVS